MTIEEFRRRYAYDVRTDLIGEGGFARVYKAEDKVAHRTVALKFYHGDTDEKYGLLQEIRRVMRLNHRNIVRFFDALLLESPSIYDPQGKIQVGVAEYVNSGDLNDFLKTFPDEAQLHKIVRDILNGLDYLHQNGVIHRDIKPQNILLHCENKQYIAKITDFGLAKNVDSSSLSSKLMGTMEYMSPEQFDTNKYGINGKIGVGVDLWSLGVILYEMFTGDLPFGNRHEGVTHEQLLFNILQKDIRPDLSDVPEPFRTLIARCLVRKAEQRAQSARELINLLEGNAPIPAQLPADSLPSAAFVLSNTEKKQLLFKSLYLTPLYLWRVAQKEHHRNLAKSKAIKELIWWAVPLYLAALLIAMLLIIVLLYAVL
jgi:serine/threonine protein kinase